MTFTKSQHHRPAEVGRDLWKPSDLTPMLKQGHLQTVAQNLIWTAFYCLQGWTPASLGNLWQCLVTLTVTNCLLMFRGKLLCVFQPLNHLCGPEISTVCPCLLLRSAEPDAALQVWPRQSISLLCSRATLLNHGKRGVDQELQLLSSLVAPAHAGGAWGCSSPGSGLCTSLAGLNPAGTQLSM